MPRWQYVLDAKLNEYAAHLRSKRRREETIVEYRRVIRRAFQGLAEAGLATFPRRVGEEEVAYLYTELYSGLEPLVARTQLSIVGRFLAKSVGNNVVERLDLEWPESERINVKWLEPAKAMALLRAAQGAARVVVHLELCCLLRRCEVQRLSVQDLRHGAIQVAGKGRVGGKPRTIPFHPRTQEELLMHQELRDEIVARARSKGWAGEVPEALLIYERNGRLGAYKTTSIDELVKSAARSAGIPEDEVSNHVLRRTGARMLKRAGVPTITIMRILGHSSEEQTLRYIGWQLGEMQEGLEAMEAYMSGIELGGGDRNNSLLAR
jgi:integrase